MRRKNIGIYIIIAVLLLGGAGITIAAYFFTRGAPQKMPEITKEQTENTKKPQPQNAENIEKEKQMNSNQNLNQNKNTIALIKTNFGNIKLKLFDADAPRTTENFIKLSESGFYNGVKFHRVIKGFMIQTGDPNSKDNDWSNDGIGGPGYVFADEINNHKIVKGALAMANSGPNTNGSQFFILTAESAPWLYGKHTVFGEVIEGMDTVIKIENVNTDKSRNDHPTQDIIILSIEITK